VLQAFVKEQNDIVLVSALDAESRRALHLDPPVSVEASSTTGGTHAINGSGPACSINQLVQSMSHAKEARQGDMAMVFSCSLVRIAEHGLA
jgi:hypothetical protein